MGIPPVSPDRTVKQSSQKQHYLAKLAEKDELGLIDDHAWIEMVHADLPPLMAPVKVNPATRIFSNVMLAAGIGLIVTYLAHLIAPMWLAGLCGVSCSILYLCLWLGSMGDSRNA